MTSHKALFRIKKPKRTRKVRKVTKLRQLIKGIRTLQKKGEKRNRALAYLGGKCILCDYDKCTYVLEIHHKIRRKKKFSLGSHWHKSWPELQRELDKCVILCANCHSEIHRGGY